MAARRITGIAIACLLLTAAAASAQSTRVEAISREQAEKAQQLDTEGPSNAEQVIRRVLLSPLLSGGDGVYPWFGSVYSGTGMGAGVGFLKRLEKAASVNVQSGVSINNSMVMRGSFAAPELWRGMMQIDGSAQWMNARGVSFYGLGQDSDRRNHQRFDYSPKDVSGNLTIKPMRHVSLSGGYSLLAIKTERDSTPFGAREAPGLDRSLTYHVTRGTIAYDWRPAASYSTRGGYYRATFERNKEANRKPYTFNSREYELVQMVPLVKEQFVLAARALITLTDTGRNQDVPVMLAPFLGSGAALRGFANRRFTDRNRALFTGEYRWRPSRYLDMALFMDAGQVSRDHHFSTDEFDVAWGIGVRLHGPTYNALRIELARGREGMRLVFAGSQPF